MSLDPVARHGFIGLAPGRVEVVRAGLDLPGAGIDTAERRLDAPGAALLARGLLGCVTRTRDVGVRDAEPLQA